MKNKVILLLTTVLLLTGCNAKKNSSNSGSNGSNSGSSEPAPIEYGYGFYGGYYGELKWNNGEDLKIKLHSIIRNGYQPLRYTAGSNANWESNTVADHSKFDYEFLDVVYTKDDVPVSYTQTGWQREHAFAASLMTDSTTGNAVKCLGRATDFHNLFAGGSSGNSSRGNKNFGTANKADGGYKNYTVDDGQDGYSYDSTTFEPGNKDKGRLARAIFYMSTMYKDDEYDDANEKTLKGLKIVEENVSYSSGNCQFAIGNLSTLLSWNNAYSVDYLEMQHNESVYSHIYSKDSKAQGNRNPYVDYPSLVDYVYGSKKDKPGDLSFQKPACYELESNSSEFSHYAIAEAKREYTLGETFDASDVTVYKVNKNYTSTVAPSSEYTCSLTGHTFVAEDGEALSASITAGEQTIFYAVKISAMQSCSYYSGRLNGTAGSLTNGYSGDQNISWNGVPFTVNISGGTQYTVSNNNQLEGIQMGSNTNNKEVTQVSVTTVNSYTVDRAFIAARAGNSSSSYTLYIKVGDTTVYTHTVGYDANKTNVYGESFSQLTGKVTFIFVGEKALTLGAIAYNVVS